MAPGYRPVDLQKMNRIDDSRGPPGASGAMIHSHSHRVIDSHAFQSGVPCEQANDPLVPHAFFLQLPQPTRIRGDVGGEVARVTFREIPGRQDPHLVRWCFFLHHGPSEMSNLPKTAKICSNNIVDQEVQEDGFSISTQQV